MSNLATRQYEEKIKELTEKVEQLANFDPIQYTAQVIEAVKKLSPPTAPVNVDLEMHKLDIEKWKAEKEMELQKWMAEMEMKRIEAEKNREQTLEWIKTLRSGLETIVAPAVRAASEGAIRAFAERGAPTPSALQQVPTGVHQGGAQPQSPRRVGGKRLEEMSTEELMHYYERAKHTQTMLEDVRRKIEDELKKRGVLSESSEEAGGGTVPERPPEAVE